MTHLLRTVSILALMTLVGLALTFDAAAAQTFESSTLVDGVTIDGTTDDWGDSSVVYLEESLRIVSVSHDETYIYLMYRFGDMRLAERLMRRGVVFWINGDGKKKNKDDAFGVRYAGSHEVAAALEEEREVVGGDSSGELSRGRRDRQQPPGMRTQPGELVVIREGVKETVSGNDSTRFLAASTFINGVYAYELRIPIDEIGGKIVDARSSKKRKLAVGIQIAGLTEVEKELVEGLMRDARGDRGGMGGRSGGMGGRPGGSSGMGGMGGRPGGGMGGMRPGGHDGGRPEIDPDIVWLVVELPPASP